MEEGRMTPRGPDNPPSTGDYFHSIYYRLADRALSRMTITARRDGRVNPGHPLFS